MFLRSMLVPTAVSLIAPAAFAAATVVESSTPAVSQTGLMVEDVGIETLGGVFTPLIKVGCEVPCSSKQVFSTADDNQLEIKITVLRGKARLAKDGHRLGTYAVVGIAPEKRGVPSVAVTLTVTQGQITLEAFDNHANRQLVVQRREF